jgi:hypothetical protein
VLKTLTFVLLLTLPAAGWAQGLTPIEGGQTFYFSATADPSNAGCDGSQACPWGGLQVAYDHVRTHFRLVSGAIVFQLADGTYARGLQATSPILGQPSPQQFRIIGNPAHPERVVIRPTGTQPSFVASYGGMFYLDGVKMDHTATAQDMIIIGQYSTVQLGHVEFGYNFNPYNHITVNLHGYLEVLSSYKISGGGQCHILLGNQATAYFNTNGAQGLIDVDISTNPDFYAAFLYLSANSSGNIQAVGWHGAARGRKFLVEGNSTLDIGGTHPCDVPGNQSGLRRTGGQLLTHPGDFVH